MEGPFSAGATITVATAAMCYGPNCTDFLIPKQVGQLVMIFSLGDAQPIYPLSVDGIDVDKKTRYLYACGSNRHMTIAANRVLIQESGRRSKAACGQERKLGWLYI